MRGLEHKIWHREGFWHVVSDFVGFFADVDVRAFEENRVQVGFSFVKEDCIGDVDSNVSGALAGESESLEKDGFLFRCAVLDVFVPVVVELLFSVDLLVFVGEFEEVVRQAEEDDIFKNFQDFTDNDVAVLKDCHGLVVERSAAVLAWKLVRFVEKDVLELDRRFADQGRGCQSKRSSRPVSPGITGSFNRSTTG